MNLQTLFRNPFASSVRIPKDVSLASLIDPYSIYKEEANSSALLLQVLAKAEAHAHFPWTFDMLPTSCCLFLYSQKGSGSIRIDGFTHLLQESSLLLLDCNRRYKLQIEADAWDFQCFIIVGSGLSAFLSILPPEGFLLTEVRQPSLCYSYLEQLDVLCYQHKFSSRLQMSDLLHRIFTFCTLAEQTAPSDEVPVYLDAIKTLLENEYASEHSLDDLEARFHVSKYRICHEFKDYYHMSPLQYLNWRRIEAAKVLLTSTPYKVHQVAHLVGIDNTNHFINLFKKYNQYTPLEYKRRMMQ